MRNVNWKSVTVQGAIITVVGSLVIWGLNQIFNNEKPAVSVGGNNYGQVFQFSNSDNNTVVQQNLPPEGEISGLLLPGKWPNPPIPSSLPDFMRDDWVKTLSRGFALYLGSNICHLTHAKEVVVLKVKGQELIRLNVTPEGAYVSATIIREDGRVVAQIRENKYAVNPNNYFESPIRVDKSTIRVRDRNGGEALYARFLNERAFQIMGVFNVPGARTVTIASDRKSVV